MKLGAQFVEKSVLNIEHLYSCILNIFFRLMSLILLNFHNHVFYINFAQAMPEWRSVGPVQSTDIHSECQGPSNRIDIQRLKQIKNFPKKCCPFLSSSTTKEILSSRKILTQLSDKKVIKKYKIYHTK